MSIVRTDPVLRTKPSRMVEIVWPKRKERIASLERANQQLLFRANMRNDNANTHVIRPNPLRLPARVQPPPELNSQFRVLSHNLGTGTTRASWRWLEPTVPLHKLGNSVQTFQTLLFCSLVTRCHSSMFSVDAQQRVTKSHFFLLFIPLCLCGKKSSQIKNPPVWAGSFA